MIKLVMTKPVLALSVGLVAAATMGLVGCGPNHHTQPAKQPEAQTIVATPGCRRPVWSGADTGAGER